MWEKREKLEEKNWKNVWKTKLEKIGEKLEKKFGKKLEKKGGGGGVGKKLRPPP